MIVAINEVRWVEVRKPAKERLAKAEREHLCLACLEPLGDQAPIRGCHPKCHRATLRAIADRKCTEAERMTEGKLLPATKGGRKPSNPVTKEMAK